MMPSSQIERLHVLALGSDVEQNNGKNESETQFSFPRLGANNRHAC